MNNNQNEQYDYTNINSRDCQQYSSNEYGSIFLRFIAYMIDTVIISIIALIIIIPTIILSVTLSPGSEEMSFSGLIVLMIGVLFCSIVIVLYYCLMISKMQGTLGKKICRLKVVNEDTGRNLTFIEAFIRLIIFDVLGFLSLIGLAFNKKSQTVHDLGAKSVVLKK